MATIITEGNKLAPDTYIEFFDFDSTLLHDKNNNPGSISYWTNTPTGGDVSPIVWRTNQYFPVPFQITGVDYKGDGTAPNRPQISISNVNKYMVAAIIAYGNLVGMRITRWRTFFKFTDAGTEPNINMHYPIDQWTVIRKVVQTNSAVQFELAGPLDRPGLVLPRKQILKDKGFPGVSRIRLR